MERMNELGEVISVKLIPKHLSPLQITRGRRPIPQPADRPGDHKIMQNRCSTELKVPSSLQGL
jgi:hypothetical protein